MIGSIFFLLTAYFIPVMKSWRIFYWIAQTFPQTSIHYKNLMDANNWNFAVTLSCAFIGAGMMTPMNTHLSTNFGSLLAWGIIGPIILSTINTKMMTYLIARSGYCTG